MEFIDLKRQLALIEPDLMVRVRKVIENGHYILGPEIKELETVLADFTGRKYCISCANGTDALLMALMALKIGPGDAVFTTAFSFFATAEVIALAGATPVFVDIDETYNMSVDDLEEKVAKVRDGKRVTEGTPERLVPKAVLPVDLFGLVADYGRIEPVAKQYGLHIIEDAAQAFGGVYKGKKACSFGGISTTSFFPAKPLGCYGDGGALFTDDPGLASVLESIRVHGKGTDKYDNVRMGLNARLDTLQAAILLAKWRVFEGEIAAKQIVARKYREQLNRFVLQRIPQDCSSAWAQFCIQSPHRDAIINALKKENIPTAIYYPKPLHLQTAFGYLKYPVGSCPYAEKVAAEIFSIPMHAYLSDEEVAKICSIVNNS